MKGATRRLPPLRRPSLSFDPRAREGRDARSVPRTPPLSGFDPRAREGRDQFARASGHAADVSIRAPVKGATQRCMRDATRCAVSIRAPVKGATSARRRDAELGGFDPRAREGRDPRSQRC